MFPKLVSIDLGALYWFQSQHRPFLDQFMMTITHLGDIWFVMTLAAICLMMIVIGAFRVARFARWDAPIDLAGRLAVAETSLLRVKDRLSMAIVLLFIMFSAWFLNELLKNAIGRPRPDISFALIEKPASLSFPSGHALLGMTLYGTLAMLVGRRCQSVGLARLIGLLAAILILIIGASRLYLGVHFVTDVLGGWLLGGALVLIGTWLDRPAQLPLQPGVPLSLPPSPGPGMTFHYSRN